MTYYELSALGAGIFHLVLTIFILSRNLRSTINKAYALWGGALTLWNWAGYMNCQSQLERDAASGWLWVRLLYLSTALLPQAVYCLYMLIGGVKKTAVLVFILLGSTLFGGLALTSWLVPGILPHPLGYKAVAGPLYEWYWGFIVLSSGLVISLIYRQQATLQPLHRVRLRWLWFAFPIIAFIGLREFELSMPPSASRSAILYPIGNLATVFFGVFVAYGVLQHQFASVHIALSRAAVQLMRIFVIFLAGFLIMALLFLMMPAKHQFVGTLLALLATAALASLLLPRLLSKSEQAVELRILGDRFEYQERMRVFIESIPFYNDADSLMMDLHQMLLHALETKSYQIILQDDAKHSFQIYRCHPPALRESFRQLTSDSPIFHFFQSTNAHYLPYKLAYANPDETDLERLARQQLREFDPEFCYPLAADGLTIGLLLVSEKSSGNPFTVRDVKLMAQAARHLGLVLNQIRLKRQLLLVEEMELLGTMSRGIAHDLNNLLTPITTFMQLAADGEKNRPLSEELLPTAMRNLESIRKYVRESLFFSRTQSLQVKGFQLDRALHEGVELVRAVLKEKALTTAILSPADVWVEMDEILFQRLLGNLLSNAIDASPEGARIQICLERFSKSDSGNSWLRLRVIDQGEGISRENIKRVTAPYFTTKDRGSSRRGYGLGLAICRKIVHLHGGHLSIISEEKKGTTVQVDLPDHQTAQPRAELPIGME
jgi:signal transduction histidine kinase